MMFATIQILAFHAHQAQGAQDNQRVQLLLLVKEI